MKLRVYYTECCAKETVLQALKVEIDKMKENYLYFGNEELKHWAIK